MEKKEELALSLSAGCCSGRKWSACGSGSAEDLCRPVREIGAAGRNFDSWRPLSVRGSPQHRNTPKVAEAEFLLILSHSPLSPVPKWKMKRLAGWDKSGEWKYLTALHGHSAKRLREKFNQLDVKVCDFSWRRH